MKHTSGENCSFCEHCGDKFDIKCEEQLTVEKEVGEHVDEQAEFQPVSEDRETDIVLNASLFS